MAAACFSRHQRAGLRVTGVKDEKNFNRGDRSRTSERRSLRRSGQGQGQGPASGVLRTNRYQGLDKPSGRRS